MTEMMVILDAVKYYRDHFRAELSPPSDISGRIEMILACQEIITKIETGMEGERKCANAERRCR